MARAQGARARMTLAFETVYDTPSAGGYTRVPFAGTSLGAQQPLLASELLGYGRDPLDARVSFRRLGESMSIETAVPEVPRLAMYSGCALDLLSRQLQRSGIRTATAQLVAQRERVATTTVAETPAQPELKRFGQFKGSITHNGTALGNVVLAEITYANKLHRIETLRSDGRIVGAVPSIAALTGRVEVRFADSILVYQAIAGDPCDLRVRLRAALGGVAHLHGARTERREKAMIEPLLPNKPRGVPRVDDRRVTNGILWRFRTGAPWRNVPERYGPRTTLYNRFVRWRAAGLGSPARGRLGGTATL